MICRLWFHGSSDNDRSYAYCDEELTFLCYLDGLSALNLIILSVYGLLSNMAAVFISYSKSTHQNIKSSQFIILIIIITKRRTFNVRVNEWLAIGSHSHSSDASY